MLTNYELIESTINLNKHIILSTGMSTLDEIDKAVDVMKGNCKYTLLHCNSTYPAKDDELNLRVINTLQKRYDCPIGYSGHERDLEAPLIAITLGARIIERHVTLSHEMWGTDHQSSLEVHAMDMLKKRADKVLPMLGSEIKTITDGEISVREKLRG
jgi:N-acetylneuraminate synthase